MASCSIYRVHRIDIHSKSPVPTPKQYLKGLGKTGTEVDRYSGANCFYHLASLRDPFVVFRRRQVCVPVDVVLWNPWIAKAKVGFVKICWGGLCVFV